MKTKILSGNGFIDPSDSMVKCYCVNAITARLRASKIYPGEITVKKVDSSANAVTILPARREFLEDATLQVETATVVGTVSTAGNATVVVTCAGINELTLSVPVALNDTASIVATKIKAALTANAQIGNYNTGLFDVSGSGATVVLTQVDPTGNDSTLNISIDNGTCAGLTTAATSTNTTAGVAVTLALQNDKKVFMPIDTGWVIIDEYTATPTLVSPVLTTPKIVTGGSINDGGGDEYIKFTEATTPVTHIGVTSGNTGVAPQVRGLGETNTNLLLAGNGTGNVTIGDGADITKLLSVELVGATTAKTMTLTSSQTDNRNLTLPDATDTLTGKATTDLLTNKTLGFTLGAHDYAAGVVDWTLSAAELLVTTHKPTNASGPVNAIVATASVLYVFINATGQTLTVKTPSGTGVAITNGKTAIVMSDGTNVIALATQSA